MYQYNVIIFKDGDMYVAKNLDLWVVSQWYTMDEAIKNIQEATELYLEDDYEEVKNHIYSPVFLTSLSAKVAHHG